MIAIELNQTKVKRASPYIKKLSVALKGTMKDIEVKRISERNMQFAPIVIKAKDKLK